MKSDLRFYLVVSFNAIFIIIYLYLVCNKNSKQYFPENYYSKRRSVVNTNIYEDYKKYRLYTKGCKIHDLPLYDDETRDLFEERHNNKTIWSCKHARVKFERYDGTSIRLVSFDTRYRPLCYYRSLKMGPNGDKGDFRYGLFTWFSKGNHLNLPDFEFVHILCYERFEIIKREIDENFNENPDLIHNEIIPLIPVINKSSNARLPNVLLLSIGSTSYVNFKRHFLRTAKFLNKNNFFELRGYNKVGDNTFANMILLLTGHNPSEFVSDEMLNNTYFDEWPIIWKEYSNRGFVTTFLEDMPSYGLFHNSLLGFKSKPTDYQTRPFHMKIIKEKYRSFCYLDKTETERNLDWTLDFVRAMNKRKQKYFAYISISEMTNDWEEGGHYMDVPFYHLFLNLFFEKLVENTVIFFFSDHGIRFGRLRGTHSGEVENRLPFMFIHLPENFKPRYKQNLRQNQFRLTTPFDIHETLTHLIRGARYKAPDDNLPLGKSLIGGVINAERDCNRASIPEMFCSCYEDIEIYDIVYWKYALPKIMDRINSLTKNYRFICSEYQLVSINKLFVRSLTQDFSEFKSNDSLIYIIQIYVNPGMALFQTVLKDFDQNSTFEIIGDIIRINSYGKQSHCISDKILKNYCYCNDLLE